MESKIENPLKATVAQIDSALYSNGIFDRELYLKLFFPYNKSVRSSQILPDEKHWITIGIKNVKSGKYSLNLSDLCSLTGNLYLIKPPDNITYENFNENAYLKHYKDLAAAGVNPLSHWLDHGRFERRIAPGRQQYINRITDQNQLQNFKFGINLLGMMSMPTGLGKATLGYHQGIEAEGIPNNYHEIPIKAFKHGLSKHSLVKKFIDKETYKVSIIQVNADLVSLFDELCDIANYDSTYKIGVWFWELPQFRSDWYTSFAAFDEIWVASEFCKAAIQPMINIPVIVIPPAVLIGSDCSKYSRKDLSLPEDCFLFAYIFDVSSLVARKNPYGLIRAFRNAFSTNNKVKLVLKYHASGGNNELAMLEDYIKYDTQIITINKTFSSEELEGFKACVDCFVSPHRSEGFGLNLAEMLLHQKPVIATDYAATTDFLNESTGYPVKYEMIELDRWIGPYPAGATWANPDEEHLASLMRRVFEDPLEANAKAKRGREFIMQKYSPQRVGQLIYSRLKELGLTDAEEPQLWRDSYGLTKCLAHHEPFAEIADDKISKIIDKLPRKPKLSVIIPVYNIAPNILEECIESVQQQSYPNWEICVVDDCSTKRETIGYLNSLIGRDSRLRIRFLNANLGISGCMNQAITMASGEFIAFLDNDDIIHKQALLRIVQEINNFPAVDVIYTDEMKLDENGHVCDSYYKPDSSPEHIESVMYWLHFFVVRKRTFMSIGGFREEYSGAQDYDLALRLSRHTRRISHLDEPLYLWRKIPGSASDTVDAKPEALLASKRALQDHAIKKYGPNALVENTRLTGVYHLRKYPTCRPSVTLVICTDNQSKDIEGRGYINMVVNLYQSIIENTTYPNYKVLIADNGICNVKPYVKNSCKDTKIISYWEKERSFNFARKLNWVVSHVDTEYFVILNDDMDVVEKNWLDYLMDHIQDPEIGGVGAKLLTSTGSIQHVGVVITVNGSCKHVYHGYPADFIGYNGYTDVIRNYSAVTGACLATKKSLYDEVGGFDEVLAVDYNDIDYCLKLRQRGYRIVYHPHAVLYHFENSTVPRTKQDKNETDIFRQRWSQVLSRDPFYNKNLTQDKHDFSDIEPAHIVYTNISELHVTQ